MTESKIKASKKKTKAPPVLQKDETPTTVDSKQAYAADSVDKVLKKKAGVNEKTKKQKPTGAHEARLHKSESSPKRPKKSSLDNLKSYVVKCGVHKNWKRELEGMSETESIVHVKRILEELGVEGKPTLAKCAEAKEKRERDQEMQELEANPVFETKLRREKGKVSKEQSLTRESELLLKHLSCIADSD